MGRLLDRKLAAYLRKYGVLFHDVGVVVSAAIEMK